MGDQQPSLGVLFIKLAYLTHGSGKLVENFPVSKLVIHTLFNAQKKKKEKKGAFWVFFIS